MAQKAEVKEKQHHNSKEVEGSFYICSVYVLCMAKDGSLDACGGAVSIE